MPNIVGVRLREAGKIFYYDAGDLELHTSDYVVVESSSGLTVGRVVVAPDQVIINEFKDEVRPVIRLATQEDVERHSELRRKAEDDAGTVRAAIAKSGLPMSLAGGEYDLEGGHFTAFFTAPDRVDFRNLTRDLSRDLGVRVQFVQVGDRDRAKLVDGIDICGERLCCSSWMTSFPSVSIRMAKEQDLPLNPQKISGVCGRLYCCLTFEYEEYKALRGTLPKVGSMVSTPVGEAKIAGIDFMRERVKLYLTETRQVYDMAIVDLQLQHGVTVRPMELVHKVEGGMRTIAEDSESRARTQTEPRPRPVPGAEGRGRRERGRAPRAQAPRPGVDSDTERQIDEALRSSGRVRPEARGDTPPESSTAAAPEPSQGDAQRRRRRRRRGRGGGGPRPDGPTPRV
jgi:cell fate regulator YaaT (PSP1 superfamily)